MGRIAGSGQVRQDEEVDLSRILHPSYGLPRRVVLSLVGETQDDDLAAEDDDAGHVAEVTRIDAVPGFLAARPSGRRPGRP